MKSYATVQIKHHRNMVLLMSVVPMLVMVFVIAVFYLGNDHNKVANAATPTTEYGLHMDLTYDGYAWRRTDHVNAAKSVGAQISRNSLLWHQIEPTQGTKDWSRTDAVVNELTDNGIEPLFVLVGSPSWANGTPTTTSEYQFYIPSGTGAAFNTWADSYAEFARQAAARYKTKVKKWEVWNEPNEHFSWKPAPSLDQYAILYTKVRTAILSEDPTAQIATGGLAGLCCNNPAAGDISGYNFLQGLIDRNLQIDNVAIHPYDGSSDPPDIDKQWENNFTDTSRIRDIMVSGGLSSKKIWITEWGWSTANINETLQAQYLQKSLEMIRDQYTYVSVAIYFVDVDRGTTYLHGLFREASPPVAKPAADVFANFIKSLAPPPVPSSPPPPNPSPTPSPVSSPAPSTEPVLSVSGANQETPVEIPSTIKPDEDGVLVADFNGDGINDIAKDSNNDGKIDPKTELISPVNSSSRKPLLLNESSSGETKTNKTISIRLGFMPEVRIAKPVAYTFIVAQAVALTGIGTYFAITKLTIFAGIRGRWGL